MIRGPTGFHRADTLCPYAALVRTVGPTATVLEIRGGSGVFAEHAIKQLMAIDAMPARYAILEPSADLRERQRERLQSKLTPLVFECVEWLDGALYEPWRGSLLATDVANAVPKPALSLRHAPAHEDPLGLHPRRGST